MTEQRKLNYMQEVEAWLIALLLDKEDGETAQQWLDRIVEEIKAKLLESFKNGKAAAFKRQEKK